MYRLFASKKGFTFIEIMITVAVLGVLVAIAVPIYSGTQKRQQAKDCLNQCKIIEFNVHAVMSGMEDNGRKIVEFVDKGTQNRYVVFFCNGTDNGARGEKNPTLDSFRFGYTRSVENRSGELPEDYMKKDVSKDKLSSMFTFGEIPPCPFQDESRGVYHEYRIYYDGTVRCTCQSEYADVYEDVFENDLEKDFSDYDSAYPLS